MSDYPYEAIVVLGDKDEIVEYTGDEVVRCKDCRHWKENHRKEKYCNKFGYLFGINDFCSYGERADK